MTGLTGKFQPEEKKTHAQLKDEILEAIEKYGKVSIDGLENKIDYRKLDKSWAYNYFRYTLLPDALDHLTQTGEIEICDKDIRNDLPIYIYTQRGGGAAP